MSYISAGTKLLGRPEPRVHRNKEGDVIIREHWRTEQGLDVRRLKRSRPEGTSLKEHAKRSTVGNAWRKRKSGR